MASSIIRNFIAKKIFQQKGAIANRKSVDFSVNALEQRLKSAGINPNDISSEKELNQVLSYVKKAEDAIFDQRYRVIAGDTPEGRRITEKLLGKRGEVVDMAGKKLDTSQGIMGGKSVKELMDSGQVSKGARGMKKSKKVQDREMFQGANKRLKTEAQLKAEMEANNKKGVAGIKKQRQLTDDEIRDYEAELGDSETWMMDGTVGEAETALKNQKAYIRDMELEYRKGNLDPEPGSRTPQRKRFLQSKLDEAETSGDARLLSREEREELFDLDDIPEYADGGVAGLLGERPGYSVGNVVQPNNDFMNLGLGNITQGQNTQTAGLFGFGKSDEEKALEQIQDLRDKENQIKGLGEGAIELKQDELKDIEQQIQDLKNQYSDDEDIQQAYDPYAGIKGQTAGLLNNPFTRALGMTLISGGTMSAPAIAEMMARQKLMKEAIFKPGAKILSRKLKTSGSIKDKGGGSTTTNSGGGSGDVGGNKNVGGGNTAKNSKGQTAAQATSAGTGTSQGYSQHFADGGPARQNFKMGKRAFLKLMGGVGAGIAGLKSGLLGFGKKEATKKAVTETVKSAGSGTPPPYFFRLVEKIKFMGDDTLATTDKAIAKKYKDYTMEEDFAGNIEIIKKGDNVAEDVYISYKVDDVPLRGKKGSKRIEEYEEYTARPDAEGKMKDIEQGVPDEVIDEAGDTTAMTLKKASGGIARMLGE